MKNVIFISIIMFFISNLYAQDIIIKKDGSEIKSKITEVTLNEIKYKRFDNIDGPIYTIVKTDIFKINYKNGTSEVFNQDQNQTKINNNCKIYFLRDTGFNGSATGFKTFIDDKFACRLNNKKYSVHEVEPGKHYVSVQFSGKTSKESAEKLEITTESNKSYYVQIMFKTGFFANDTYCTEVTENTAKSILNKLELDTDCE